MDAPSADSTTSETPFRSSRPTASTSAAGRDLHSKRPQSPPSAALSSLEMSLARPAKSSPDSARFRMSAAWAVAVSLVLGREGDPDPADADLLGALELGSVVPVVGLDLGVLDLDLLLEIVGLEEQVIPGPLLGDPVGGRVGFETGPDVRLGGLVGGLDLRRFRDEVLDLRCFVLLPVVLPDLLLGHGDAGGQDEHGLADEDVLPQSFLELGHGDPVIIQDLLVLVEADEPAVPLEDGIGDDLFPDLAVRGPQPHARGDLEEEPLLDELLQGLLGDVELTDEIGVEAPELFLHGLEPLAEALEIVVPGDPVAADVGYGVVAGPALEPSSSPDDEDADHERGDDDPQDGLERFDVVSHCLKHGFTFSRANVGPGPCRREAAAPGRSCRGPR
jgi:hypothetical protein